jgi:hypothetical protein
MEATPGDEMGAPAWLDSKLIIYGVGLAVAGVLAYARLDVLGESMAKVQTTLDEQADGLAEHTQDGNAHATRALRVSSLETDQATTSAKLEQMDTSIDKIGRNQARMCQQWGVLDCE